ncbi:hypothetical protein [Flavobacterium sp.]|uniref:hypothetical protein n=1 Tax=Flavobacterium sp. TaxID=239 RepID=UPI002B4B4D03|nr:hypothetical protein [Flavobacterium sp.]HLP64605.1 hypothetical protein [Flavobacterium sp.]
MKLNNRTLIYIYVGVLFVLTYLFASKVILGLKTQEFDWLRLLVNLGLIIYIVIKVVKLGKIENDKTE